MVIAPSSDSLAADLAPPAALGRYLSIYQVSWSAGAVLVPAGGAALLDSAPAWFWLVFVLTAAAGGAAATRVAEPARVAGSGRILSPAERPA
jgi:hypothetical protein